MFQSDQTKEIQQQTRELLKTIENISSSQVTVLREVLHFHEYRYYILNDPLISDYEYDQLYKALEKIEKDNPELIISSSPTQRVGKGLTKEFPTVQHLVPMLSLDNSYNSDDLLDFDRKIREVTGEVEIEYCVEPKFDGASISLLYEDDKLVRGATRGDGVYGDDITPNIRQIRTIPLAARFASYGLDTVEIRGEVLINKNNFAKFNEAVVEAGGQPLANPRNAASGTLRIKDPLEVGRRKLEAFTYSLGYFSVMPGHEGPHTHSETLEMLWNLGFRSPQKEMKVLNGIQAVIDYCTDFEAHRDDLPY